MAHVYLDWLWWLAVATMVHSLGVSAFAEDGGCCWDFNMTNTSSLESVRTINVTSVNLQLQGVSHSVEAAVQLWVQSKNQMHYLAGNVSLKINENELQWRKVTLAHKIIGGMHDAVATADGRNLAFHKRMNCSSDAYEFVYFSLMAKGSVNWAVCTEQTTHDKTSIDTCFGI
ncbi:uncharacterized protein LOC122263039 [Penaeus japonicus]|uniref:uncharacterized protein LOC122263039 n=1 Tax=Penaeus japonicus TaxID=27405 RepID=UPI001C711640|nr:uncharacterized protein LOC122263039 [Penaeus japonicus]